MDKRRWIILVSLLALFVLFFQTGVFEKTEAPAITYSARSEDGAIVLSWEFGEYKGLKHTRLTISDGEEKRTEEFYKWRGSYSFQTGEHGKMYKFTLAPIYEDKGVKPVTFKRMFLDYEKLPELPLIELHTPTGEEPTYTESIAPKNGTGASIKDNAYVEAVMDIHYEDGVSLQDSVEFRIRGNTSALGEVKPYRLKLSEPMNLLREEDAFNSKEWVLLPQGHNLKTLAGKFVAELCESGWQPDMQYVNLMINGDWKGCYLLVETVDIADGKYGLSDSDFLIENDAYWWNVDEVYFKSEYLYYTMEYTIKHPDPLTLSDRQIDRLSRYMNQVEKSIYENGNYEEYLDVDSFASWILTHDVLGTEDSGGSNMYMYHKDGRLHMGPVWDLDSINRTKDQWSNIHINDLFYFNQLFKDAAFTEVYGRKWQQVGGTFYEEIEKRLCEYVDQYGPAIQESWNLHTERWGKDIWSVEQQLDLALDWYQDRVLWMNENVNDYKGEMNGK